MHRYLSRKWSSTTHCTYQRLLLPLPLFPLFADTASTWSQDPLQPAPASLPLDCLCRGLCRHVLQNRSLWCRPFLPSVAWQVLSQSHLCPPTPYPHSGPKKISVKFTVILVNHAQGATGGICRSHRGNDVHWQSPIIRHILGCIQDLVAADSHNYSRFLGLCPFHQTVNMGLRAFSPENLIPDGIARTGKAPQ